MGVVQLSLLETTVLKAVSSTGSTKGCYRQVSGVLGLTSDDMSEKVFRGDKAGYVGKWQHKIRLIQQRLKRLGLIDNSSKRGYWKLTTDGRKELTKAPNNSSSMYFTTRNGVAFWGDARDIVNLFEGEIDLVVTSPPYLLSKDRSYGGIGRTEKEYVENLLSMIESWLPMLTSTASIVINLGNSVKDGKQQLHKELLTLELREKLGVHLVQKFPWVSKTKIPTGYWTTIAKRDCVDKTEEFFWFSLNPKKCKANNQNILVEYSESQKRQMLKHDKNGVTRKKPSGQSSNDDTFYADNGGAIPGNVLFSEPEGANSPYSRWCREQLLPRHPAMFHHSLPEFFVRYLTERGDVVFDPFLGSGNSGYAAEIHDRHWIGADLFKELLDGAAFRFREHGVASYLA